MMTHISDPKLKKFVTQPMTQNHNWAKFLRAFQGDAQIRIGPEENKTMVPYSPRHLYLYSKMWHAAVDRQETPDALFVNMQIDVANDTEFQRVWMRANGYGFDALAEQITPEKGEKYLRYLDMEGYRATHTNVKLKRAVMALRQTFYDNESVWNGEEEALIAIQQYNTFISQRPANTRYRMARKSEACKAVLQTHGFLVEEEPVMGVPQQQPPLAPLYWNIDYRHPARKRPRLTQNSNSDSSSSQ